MTARSHLSPGPNTARNRGSAAGSLAKSGGDSGAIPRMESMAIGTRLSSQSMGGAGGRMTNSTNSAVDPAQRKAEMEIIKDNPKSEKAQELIAQMQTAIGLDHLDVETVANSMRAPKVAELLEGTAVLGMMGEQIVVQLAMGEEAHDVFGSDCGIMVEDNPLGPGLERRENGEFFVTVKPWESVVVPCAVADMYRS